MGPRKLAQGGKTTENKPTSVPQVASSAVPSLLNTPLSATPARDAARAIGRARTRNMDTGEVQRSAWRELKKNPV